MKAETITRKVISYCEIPEDLLDDHWLNEFRSDSYVELNITSKQDQHKYGDNFKIVNWIIDNYPDTEGETVFIHIDY